MTLRPASLDDQLRQALSLHQARRFAEAEALYLRILALRPDLAEVHVNCALAQLSQNKRAEAEASLHRAIAERPDFAKAHFHLGGLFSLGARFDEAAASYRRAVRFKPDYTQAHNNLGNVLLLLGDTDKAAEAYRKTVALDPSFAQGHNNLGHINLRIDRPEEARAAFARAVAIAPDYAEAHNNLGIALRQLDRAVEAESAFRTAMRLAPRYADAHLNLSISLFEAGRFREAEAAAAEAVRLSPAMPEGHNALGNALRKQSKLAEAQTCYREAIRLDPSYADGYKNLGMALMESARLDEAVPLFNRHARLVYGPDARGNGRPQNDPPHKLCHDAEQQAWLGDAAAPFRIGEAPRLSCPAVNPATPVAAIRETWRTASPQIVVIDELLTSEALQALRHFCLGSTIWQKAYDGGYLGAFPEHGLATPLIAQIAEELRTVYPAIIGSHPLLQFWAFKYDSSLHGIKKHADFAAVNVNFWITPDEANLDPEHGGLTVWDVAAPLDWDFVKYNAADDDIRAFLEREGAKPVTISYRSNRAVIFDSDLFHETDTIRFKPGYENRRINITLLYGWREVSGKTY